MCNVYLTRVCDGTIYSLLNHSWFLWFALYLNKLWWKNFPWLCALSPHASELNNAALLTEILNHYELKSKFFFIELVIMICFNGISFVTIIHDSALIFLKLLKSLENKRGTWLLQVKLSNLIWISVPKCSIKENFIRIRRKAKLIRENTWFKSPQKCYTWIITILFSCLLYISDK